MRVTFIISILLCIGPRLVVSKASNSLSDCNTVAANFDNTCDGMPVVNIAATTGVNVSCSSNFSPMTCPGTMDGSTCIFQHKLCVTCSGTSTVRIRVQSNGLPPFCPNAPHPISELNVDFEVNFNPDVKVNLPVHNPATASALNIILCNIVSQASVPSASNYVSYSIPGLLNTLAGISIDGVTILNVNSANNVDPFYPTGGIAAEFVDACLGHPNPSNNGYHYHAGFGCALTHPEGNIESCDATPDCSASVANYSISKFSAYRRLTVIGIAKDGHIIYGPYDSSGHEVISGFDICNGMFHDSIGNYGYFVTRTYPYITGCFGPGNYPDVSPNCTTNGPKAYTKSSYASTQSSGAANNKLRFHQQMIVTCLLIILVAAIMFINYI